MRREPSRSPRLAKDNRRLVAQSIAMKFTYYGHACFAVEVGGKTLLFDPFIKPNPLAREIDVSQVTADFILVSHGHGDHVADVVEIAQRTGATVVAPFEAGEWLEKKGVKN